MFRKEERETRCFLKALDALLNESYGFEFTGRAALSEIALSLCGRYLGEEGQVSGTREARERERLKLMLTYIDAHYTEGLSVEEIAAVAHIGKRECQRCFQKTLGMTPLQYVLRCRVMAGADLLVNEPALSVSEVAAHAVLTVSRTLGIFLSAIISVPHASIAGGGFQAGNVRRIKVMPLHNTEENPCVAY